MLLLLLAGRDCPCPFALQTYKKKTNYAPAVRFFINGAFHGDWLAKLKKMAYLCRVKRVPPQGRTPYYIYNVITASEIDRRVALAEELFMQGYNCSQAVVAAYADLFGYTREQALRLSAGFGGGIGRMRMTCGTVCGMAALAGMLCGATRGGDREGKSENYRAVQQLAATFRERFGSVVCAELLRLKKGAPLDYVASERTAEYYKRRPCVNQVVGAARIFGDYLLSVNY